jgi:ABC-2 type transport system permease protein
VNRVFKAEWRKLRRPSLFYGTLLAVMAVTALVTSLLFLLIDSENGNSREGQMVNRAILSSYKGITIGFSGSAGLLGLVALCIFASQTAQEYTYGTLRNLLVRQPKRLTLLAGKFLSMALFSLISVILSAVVSIGLAFALSGRAKVSSSAWTTSDARTAVFQTFINVFISVIAYGTIGMILGLLLRSPISSISIGVAWLLVIETIVSAVLKNSAQWMPGQLINSVASGGDANASYTQALTTLSGYLIAGIALVAILFRRRDVSN